MEKEIKHGGSRPTSGRKPVAESERKAQINIYVQQKYIDAVGGLDFAKLHAYNSIVNSAKKQGAKKQ